MWSNSSCPCCMPTTIPCSNLNLGSKFISSPRQIIEPLINRNGLKKRPIHKLRGIRASTVDSYGSSSNFVHRMERTWSISEQPRPIACSSCDSNGHVECKWCSGTGFFIIGDNMLCEVPSRNTSCVICAGKGCMSCSDCKGTGYRAKWLGAPPISK